MGAGGGEAGEEDTVCEDAAVLAGVCVFCDAVCRARGISGGEGRFSVAFPPGLVVPDAGRCEGVGDQAGERRGSGEDAGTAAG